MQDRLTQSLERAHAERKAERAKLGVDAFRFWSGNGAEGPIVEAYGAQLVVSSPTPPDAPWLEALCKAVRPEGLVLKRSTGRGFSNETLRVQGQVPDVVVVNEQRARLRCDLRRDGPTGLFLDLQDARLRAAGRCKQGSVLNLFAHTGSFSVHAAAAGAGPVTTVDASKAALRWARDNFTQSGLDPDRHRWFADDALTVLRRAEPRSFDWIVCDPPAFGRAKRRTFKLAKDVDALWHHGVRAARKGVLFCSHAPELPLDRVTRGLEREALHQGRRVESVQQYGPPRGFAGPLLEVWMTFEDG